MERHRRTTLVFLSLVVAGATLGASAAMLAMVAAGLRPWESGFLLVFGGGLGTLLGAIFGPLVMWTILRHVPVGLAIGVTCLGTVIGGVIGMALWSPLLGAIFGFLIAAIWLHECWARAVDKLP